MGDGDAQLKLVKSDSDTVWLRNNGKQTVFYGVDRKDPQGMIESGRTKRLPKNAFFWTAVGEPDVEFVEHEERVPDVS